MTDSLLTVHMRKVRRKRGLLARKIADVLLFDEGSKSSAIRAHLIGEDGANLGDWTHASVKGRVLRMLTRYGVFE